MGVVSSKCVLHLCSIFKGLVVRWEWVDTEHIEVSPRVVVARFSRDVPVWVQVWCWLDAGFGPGCAGQMRMALQLLRPSSAPHRSYGYHLLVDLPRLFVPIRSHIAVDLLQARKWILILGDLVLLGIGERHRVKEGGGGQASRVCMRACPWVSV